MRTGRHLHHRFINAGIRVEAVNCPALLALQIRDVHQRGAVRYPEFVGAAFAFRMRFDFTHVATVFIYHPHPRIDQVMRPFMAEGDGMVIKRTINRMAQPFPLFVDHAAFAGLQVDAQQAAVGAFVEEIVENLPVVERRPVVFGNLDANQFGAIAVGHPGTVAHPVIGDAIHFTLLQRGEVNLQQRTVVLHVIKGFIIRRKETTKRVITGAFR